MFRVTPNIIAYLVNVQTHAVPIGSYATDRRIAWKMLFWWSMEAYNSSLARKVRHFRNSKDRNG